MIFEPILILWGIKTTRRFKVYNFYTGFTSIIISSSTTACGSCLYHYSNDIHRIKKVTRGLNRVSIVLVNPRLSFAMKGPAACTAACML